MRISNLTKITFTVGLIGLIFLGIATFAKLPYHYGLTALIVSGVFLIAFFFLIVYGEEQKGKERHQRVRATVLMKSLVFGGTIGAFGRSYHKWRCLSHNPFFFVLLDYSGSLPILLFE